MEDIETNNQYHKISLNGIVNRFIKKRFNILNSLLVLT